MTSLSACEMNIILSVIFKSLSWKILQSSFLIFSTSCGFLLKADNLLANVVTFFLHKAG